MSNNFKDKNITEEQENIKQNLERLDKYLIIPASIKPEKINFKQKKKISFVKPILVAACLVIILTSIFLINLNNPFVSNNYDEIKNIYLSLNMTDLDSAINEPRPETFNLERSMLDSGAGESGEIGVSNTNIQVKGVDEGDIVKTDGDNIYSINEYYYLENIYGKDIYKSSKTINITSTLRKGEIKKQSSIDIVGQSIEMYIQDKTLVVITELDPQFLDLETNEILTQDEYNKVSEEFYKDHQEYDEELYKLFYNRYQYQNKIAAMIYDVSDATSPKLIREFAQEGYYSSSRLIDEDLYLVTIKNNYVSLTHREENLRPEYIVPFTTDSIDGGNKKIIDSKDITIIENPNNYSFVVISGLNIKNSKKAKTLACLGGSNIIYSSLNALYITNPHYLNETGIMARMSLPLNSDTNIIKYTLENGKPNYKAFKRIPGSILNQYSMDEHDGYLRIATTTSNEDVSKNNIYVLDDNLDIVGKIEDLAPGERIYSVRFMDDKGYVVTYKQVDPLFAIDLSNPQDPKILGELKVPGFSSYLHPISEDLLIGIGYDTESQKSEGMEGEMEVIKGIKLSLFDVSNPLEPKEVHKFILGDQGTYSEVLYNPKALLFSKEKNILAFPVFLCEDTLTWEISYNGYYVFSFDEALGFSVKGRVTHIEEFSGNNYTDDKGYFDSLGFDIKRGVYVDDVLYTVSEKIIQANSLDDFSLIGKVDLK